MESSFPTAEQKSRNIVLAVITILAFTLTLLFWLAINKFHLQSWPLYFAQLGFYFVFALLAWWGISSERFALKFNLSLILSGLAIALCSWLIFVAVIQFFGLAVVPQELALLRNSPLWKIGSQLLSIWIFVGIGEELLFRGYMLNALKRLLALRSSQRITLKAVLLSSAVFFPLAPARPHRWIDQTPV